MDDRHKEISEEQIFDSFPRINAIIQKNVQLFLKRAMREQRGRLDEYVDKKIDVKIQKIIQYSISRNRSQYSRTQPTNTSENSFFSFSYQRQDRSQNEGQPEELSLKKLDTIEQTNEDKSEEASYINSIQIQIFEKIREMQQSNNRIKTGLKCQKQSIEKIDRGSKCLSNFQFKEDEIKKIGEGRSQILGNTLITDKPINCIRVENMALSVYFGIIDRIHLGDEDSLAAQRKQCYYYNIEQKYIKKNIYMYVRDNSTLVWVVDGCIIYQIDIDNQQSQEWVPFILMVGEHNKIRWII